VVRAASASCVFVAATLFAVMLCVHDAATARLEAIQEILQLATLEVKLNPETVRVDLLWVPATQRSGAAARRAATF